MYVFRMDNDNGQVNPQPFPPERQRTSERSERVRALREEMVEDSRMSLPGVTSPKPFLPNYPCGKHIPIGRRCAL